MVSVTWRHSLYMLRKLPVELMKKLSPPLSSWSWGRTWPRGGMITLNTRNCCLSAIDQRLSPTSPELLTEAGLLPREMRITTPGAPCRVSTALARLHETQDSVLGERLCLDKMLRERDCRAVGESGARGCSVLQHDHVAGRDAAGQPEH